jgi:hypothetical protein
VIATPPLPCEPFEAPLPFGGKIASDGRCVTYEPGEPPEDGEYGLVTVSDGEYGLAKADRPAYVAPPFQPEGGPCGDGSSGSGSGGSSAPPISGSAANLTTLNAAGQILTTITARGAGSATVTGAGTAASPLTVSVPASSASVTARTNSAQAIKVTGVGSAANPLIIDHLSALSSAVAAGDFQFDAYGHLSSYTASGLQTGVMSVNSPLQTISVQNTQGSVTLDLPDLGGRTEDWAVEALDSTLTIDSAGRVAAIAAKTPQAVTERRFAVIPPGGASLEHAFTMTARARLRFSLRGDLGLTAAGRGLFSPLPAGLTVLFNGDSPQAWGWADGGYVMGLEIATEAYYGPGQATLTIAFPSAPAGVMMLDVALCQ